MFPVAPCTFPQWHIPQLLLLVQCMSDPQVRSPMWLGTMAILFTAFIFSARYKAPYTVRTKQRVVRWMRGWMDFSHIFLKKKWMINIIKCLWALYWLITHFWVFVTILPFYRSEKPRFPGADGRCCVSHHATLAPPKGTTLASNLNFLSPSLQQSIISQILDCANTIFWAFLNRGIW